MFENTRKYVLENVLKSYQEFIDHRASNEWGENQLLRKGINSAITLYHLREHIPTSIRPSYNDLESLCGDYGLVRDITNVSKHSEIDRYTPKISCASQISEEIVNTRFEDEQGQYFSCQIDVFVKLDDGTERKLVNILYNVICMWRDVLENLGIINLKDFEPPKVDIPLSRDEATSQANMSMTSGEEYNWKYRFMEYNYKNNTLEPRDLSDHKFRFFIKRLPERIPISIHIVNPKFEIDVDFDVPLTQEQAKQYISLENDKIKYNFLESIINNDPNIKKNYWTTIIEAQIQELKKLTANEEGE